MKRLLHREERRSPWDGGARLAQILRKYKPTVKNIKLSLCRPWNGMWLGRCSSTHSLTSALDEGEESASRFGRFTIGISCTHQIGRRVNFRAGGNNRKLERRNIFLLPGIEPWFGGLSARNLVTVPTELYRLLWSAVSAIIKLFQPQGKEKANFYSSLYWLQPQFTRTLISLYHAVLTKAKRRSDSPYHHGYRIHETAECFNCLFVFHK